MKALIILNDPPDRSERCYNGHRLASALVTNDPSAEVTVFLTADNVACGKKGQKMPEGYHNLEHAEGIMDTEWAALNEAAAHLSMRFSKAVEQRHGNDLGRSQPS